MHVDSWAQAVIFGQGLLLGAALGVLYDGMRTLRRGLRAPWLAFGLDLLFWLTAIVSLFALTLLRDDGQVRIYHMVAVALGGGLLLLDEPFAGVDQERTARMLERLRGLDVPIVLATHQPQVLSACDRIIALDGPPLAQV